MNKYLKNGLIILGFVIIIVVLIVTLAVYYPKYSKYLGQLEPAPRYQLHDDVIRSVFDSVKISRGFQNAFVAKTIRKVSEEDVMVIAGIDGTGSATQYEVEVVYNIQGSIEGKIIVSQLDYFNNPEKYLIKPGNTYIFLTSNYGEKGNSWEHIRFDMDIPDLLVSTDSTLSIEQLGTLAENNYAVKRFEEILK